jgi:hypothetical protein
MTLAAANSHATVDARAKSGAIGRRQRRRELYRLDEDDPRGLSAGIGAAHLPRRLLLLERRPGRQKLPHPTAAGPLTARHGPVNCKV